jgi:hypothetical protein
VKRTPLQLAALIIGLILWGYGIRVHNDLFQWIGTGFLAVAVILRFFRR